MAIDVALTALRLGANEVTLACLEAREEMPANPWEIEEAREEGVILMPSWGPKRIIGENGRVSSVELVQCTCVFDEEGNFCPAFGTETTTVDADQVILAIGQAPDLPCIGNGASGLHGSRMGMGSSRRSPWARLEGGRDDGRER